MKNLKSMMVLALTVSTFTLLLVMTANGAASQATTTEPLDKQIIPFYEVWLRWNDVSNENHYLVSVRDITNGDSGPLIYNAQYVSKNSTYFAIPLNKLDKGHTYRWSLSTVDTAGNRTFSPNRHFRIEYGLSTGEDSHLWRTSYASASHIDYFIDAPIMGYDGIFEECVNSWNGVSSNVYLHRDYTNTTKELGIYECLSPPEPYLMGMTFPGGKNFETDSNYIYNVVAYTEIEIYTLNIPDNSNMLYTVKHEVGHALGLAHTNGVDYGYTPNYAPAGNSIAKTYDVMDSLSNYDKLHPDISTDTVPLVMNQGGARMPSYITTVDRDHLRIKWGA